ncbi:hypothetical protein V6N12_032066 [Hibiscus sabdariffa]|uniref:Uncharacterized protein n=2 Tax=Hibiscus sabdariffa TaxID=183260 RepID=A0ABR2BYZ9_9ROSI
MSEEFDFADKGNKIIYETEAKGLNPGLIVLLVVVGLLLIFLVGNYVLYTYAQKTLPPRKKKPVSKKKMKRERLKQGVSAPGEKLKVHHKANTIHSLQDRNGVRLDTFEAILGEFIQFFSESLGAVNSYVEVIPDDLSREILDIELSNEM